MKRKRMMQRALSLLLACLLIVGAPLSALAEEGLLVVGEPQLLAESAEAEPAAESAAEPGNETAENVNGGVAQAEPGDRAAESADGGETQAEPGNASAESADGGDAQTGPDAAEDATGVSEEISDVVSDAGDAELVLEDESLETDGEEILADGELEIIEVTELAAENEDGTEGENPANKLDTSNLDFGVTDPAGYVTVSFTDQGIRPSDAEIEDAELYGSPLGSLIGPVQVPYAEGDSIADVTVRLFTAMKLEYDYTGTQESGFYLAALKNFEYNDKYYSQFGEFDAGKGSGWCVRLNNWHINQSAAAIQVEDEDVISWLYTCQLGADIGADYSSKSAKITAVTMSDSSLKLEEDTESGVYTCAVPRDISSIAFEVALENYASVVSVTVDGAEAKYRPNKAIEVKKNSTVVITSKLDYMDADNNNEVTTYTDTWTIRLVSENNVPAIKAAYAETKSNTYVYGNSYVYIYMDDIFEDADGDALTYEATLNGESTELTYNSWSGRYYILFNKSGTINEYKIRAYDGVAYSDEFTATCIGASATISAPEGSSLIPNGNYYYYYIMGSEENDTFSLEYELNVETDKIAPQWYTTSTSILTVNGDGTFTVNPDLTSRAQATIAVVYTNGSSTQYFGSKYIHILPAAPSVEDVTASLAEHADVQNATVVSNAFEGWYSSEFNYTVEDPSIAEIKTSGTYGLSITPKSLGTTKVTASLKCDETVACSFTVTVTGRSLQIKDQPGADSVIFKEGDTVQMEVLGAEEGETFTWTSANEDVASVDENGLVTLNGLGQAYITAVSSMSTEEVPVKASMYLQVKEENRVYLDEIAVTDYTYFDGFISAKSGFNSAQLEYDWSLGENRYGYNKLAFTPYFDDEKLEATLFYQVSGGEEQSMTLSDGAAVSITNGLNPGENIVRIDVNSLDDAENITTYTFRIFRPYNPTNTISSMIIYPNGETALAYPTYQGYKEGTFFRWDTENGTFVQSGGKPVVNWSSTQEAFKIFVYEPRTDSVSLYPTFGYSGERVMIYVDGEPFEEAVTAWKSKTIPIGEDGAVITLHVNSEKYHAEKLADGVEDPFAEPERTYTIYVENVTPLGIDSKILSAEISKGEFYAPGFQSDKYTISGLLPNGTSSAELTFTVPEGIDVYKTSVSDANKLTADGQDEEGNNIYTTPIVSVTGSSATTNIILQITDEETGETGKTQYAFTFSQRGAKDIYPDSVEGYLCIGSQYTNADSYGTMPERTLKNGGGVLSLGNFGGYIIYKYDTPIYNDPNNPYGVDFVVYGNSFGSGGHEPGYVQVSQDGANWYTLAGSDHYEDHNDWNYSMTYINSNGKSSWVNSDGENGENYNYPKASLYPYFNWTDALENSMTVSGYRLNSSSSDSYGSAAAVLTDFGYADVSTNGTINGVSQNPYNHPGTLASGGDQFDLDWAVDANGMPVELDSISYIRVATASSIYAGAIGEKSTEVTAVNRVTNTAGTAVGETAAPLEILVNGKTVTVPENGEVLTVAIDPADMGNEENASAVLTVDVTAGEESNIYINNQGGTSRSYTAVPEKKIVRIIVQEGEKEPYICYLKFREVEAAVTDVEEKIAALPDTDKLTAADQDSVAAARAAYDALTDSQKTMVSAEALEKLEAAEARMAKLGHVHTWDTGVVTKAATCTEPGVTTYTCADCGETKTEEIPATGHSFGEWTTAAAATVSAAETQQRTCAVCGAAETRTVGEPLTPVLEVPGELNSFSIKNKTTVKFAVTMAEGDSVVSVKSANPKKVQVKSFNADGSVTLKAKKKGTAKITVTLASGKTRTYKVKSTPKVVKTKKITGVAKTLTLKKGGSVKLNPVLTPFTSTQKLTYASSNKKVAKVSAKGKITAGAAGTATITVKSGAKSVKCKVTVK